MSLESAWLRRDKWVQFYSGEFAPHLRGRDARPGIGALPWRTHGPTAALVDFLLANPLPATARCAELGCGTGENVVHLAKSSAFVLGLDIVPDAVAASAAAAQAAALDNVQACCVDILELASDISAQPPLADGRPWCFDFVVDVQTFHCLRKVDPIAAAKSCAALLAPGGTLLLITGNANEEAERGPERLTEHEVRTAFEGTSLVCEQCTEFRFEWTDTYRSQPFEQPPLGWCSVWKQPAA